MRLPFLAIPLLAITFTCSECAYLHNEDITKRIAIKEQELDAARAEMAAAYSELSLIGPGYFNDDGVESAKLTDAKQKLMDLKRRNSPATEIADAQEQVETIEGWFRTAREEGGQRTKLIKRMDETRVNYDNIETELKLLRSNFLESNPTTKANKTLHTKH